MKLKKKSARGIGTTIERMETRTFLSAVVYPVAGGPSAGDPTASDPPTESASATVTLASVSGRGTSALYHYAVTLTDTGTTTLGTFWFAWTPGEDFLTSSPGTVKSPKGWTDTITGGGSGDGFAIQWVAGSTAKEVQPGAMRKGFSFVSADSPESINGDSQFFPSTPVETSFVYAGQPFSDAGFQLVAPPVASTLRGFLDKLTATPSVATSTIPANGDVNPYGVAIVPKGFAAGGIIAAGDVLVSNFNDSANLQGTGTTIISVNPSGQQTTFFQGQTGLGLTTALGVLKRGFVLVGNVPAPDGANVDGPGSLLILDRSGNVVNTLSDPNLLDGPWDLTVADHGATAIVFVSNVLNGTVTRLKLSVPKTGDGVTVSSETEIASGYLFRTDPAALVVGPTGLALSPVSGALYVASTGDNAIYSIPNAVGRKTAVDLGRLVYEDDAHLRGPLALAFAGNNLIAANGDAVNADPTGRQNSELVEFTPGGKFVDEFQVDPTVGGAFGLAFGKSSGTITFAAIDDVTSLLDQWFLNG